MSKTLLMLSASALLALAGAAGAQRASAPPLAPDGYVAARQASLDMSSMVLSSMREAMKAGREAKTQAFAASGLAKWAKVLPTFFPAGSGKGGVALETWARPVIWSDRAGFAQAAGNYAAAAAKLEALATANDTEGFKAQLVEVNAKCDACHAVYREDERGSR